MRCRSVKSSVAALLVLALTVSGCEVSSTRTRYEFGERVLDPRAEVAILTERLQPLRSWDEGDIPAETVDAGRVDWHHRSWVPLVVEAGEGLQGVLGELEQAHLAVFNLRSALGDATIDMESTGVRHTVLRVLTQKAAVALRLAQRTQNGLDKFAGLPEHHQDMLERSLAQWNAGADGGTPPPEGTQALLADLAAVAPVAVAVRRAWGDAVLPGLEEVHSVLVDVSGDDESFVVGSRIDAVRTEVELVLGTIERLRGRAYYVEKEVLSPP